MTADSSPFHFLVVDDDEDIRSAVVGMIERLGHSADQACDGVEAVESLLLETRYDFMLLDLTMPRMSGEDVLSWLREHPRWAEGLRVVVVSGLVGAPECSVEALGAHAVLAKPIRAQQLRDLVEARRSGGIAT